MNKKTDRIIVIVFAGMLILPSLFLFFLPAQRFSDLENRYLQSAPSFTLDDILSRRLAKEAELYVSDHFPFRSKWLAVKSAAEQARLQQENNGIYKGKDGYLLEKFSEPDYEKVTQYTESINRFAQDHPMSKMTFMLLPTSAGLYPGRLPWLAPSYPQKNVNRFVGNHLAGNVRFLNGFEFLQADAGKPIYYRTDHHWTTYGAYLAYAAYAEKRGWQPASEQEFRIEMVSRSFLGSYHTKSQFSGTAPDTIEAYFPAKPVKTEMYIADTGETKNGLFEPGFLEKKDKYSYFLGGVHALAKLTTQLGENGGDSEKLLVIKDSYAHSILPFFTLHVPEIHVIDIRYYNGSIGDYMEENGIKDVLFLFNTSTFVESPAFLKLNH